MADVPGRCRELDYCSIGQMRTLVRVPLGRPFVCPECGKPLREPVLMNEPLSRKRIVWWSIGTLGLFALLYECAVPSGRPKHLPPAQIAAVLARMPNPPARPAAAPAPPKPAPPQLQIAQPAPVRPPVAPPAPEQPVPIASIAAAPIPLVLGPPVPTPLANAPMVRMPPPAPLPSEKPAAPGAKVTMECTVDSAGVPSDCTPAKIQAPPAAPPKPAPPPPADREPSVLPVAGGGPPYPTDYVRDGRAGEVAVDCTIDPDGEPEHCRVRDVFGGRRFAEATVDWLNSGTVRFRPALRGGVPVAEERRWRIAFPPRR